MAQPQWKTAAGSLGTWSEGGFYSVPILATADEETIYYQVIAGQLPTGVRVTNEGIITGIPKSIVSIQGVPVAVNFDITSKFAIRAYTTKVVNGVIVVDRLADRTFTITVTGPDAPEFITPSGNVGTYYDGTPVTIQIQYTDIDPGDRVAVKLSGGELPPGLVITDTGLIKGVIAPLVGPPGSATAGFSSTEFDQYPFDFSTRSSSKNYQFSLSLSDGISTPTIRVFEIYVYSKDSMSADTTDFTADNTFITADVVPTRTPVLLTPTGDIGRVRADNFYAFKFDAIDFDGDPIEYSITVGSGIGFDAPGTVFDEDSIGFDRGAFSLPPGLSINPDTGWFYGYIPDQGATENTYRFAIRVLKANNPSIISDFYYFTITIIGAVETEVTWLTKSDLGSIVNGSISTLNIKAINKGNRSLQYRLESGSNSRLPQGLTLQPMGDITGQVSFNTFALDGGTTIFDKDIQTRAIRQETTFDSVFEFTVNAFAPASAQIGLQVSSFIVTNGGSGYSGTPTVVISAPPNVQDAVQATSSEVTIVNGVITAVAIGNQGRGYVTPPTVTIIGGGGVGATATAIMVPSTIVNIVSVFKRFSVQVIREFNEPYQGLYIKAMPPQSDRALISQLVQNQDIIPVEYVYRNGDANFGVSSSVVYNHAFGLTAGSLEEYVAALDINHYWKNLILGEINYAQARNAAGEVIYEAVYSLVVDNLVNNAGESVSKQVTLPYTLGGPDSTEITTVYPNSLINMRDQVIDVVGQINPMLPAWMTSKQESGRVLGFVPAWVIAYVKPGRGAEVVYNIRTQFGDQLNLIDFKADRYEIDRRMTYAWEPYNDSTITGEWIPQPPAATTFDLTGVVPQTPISGTIFDMGSTVFITPANTTATTDVFDKYILYPRTNILG